MRIFKYIIFGLSGIVILAILALLIGEGFVFWKFSKEELVASLFFPFGFIAGLIIGFFKQRVGGYISVFAMFGFYLLNFLGSGEFPQGAFFMLITIPGILLLLYAILEEYKFRK